MSLLHRNRTRPPLWRRVLRPVYHYIAPVAKHPLVTMFVGLGVFATGMSEFLETVLNDFHSPLELHHGLILYGAVTTLRGIMEMAEGLEIVSIDAELTDPEFVLERDS